VRVSVVLPTVAGRESLLAQTVAGYRETSPAEHEIIVVKGQPTIGDAWNAGAAMATGDYLHLSADDFIPSSGWFEAAADTWTQEGYPAPRILNPDGSLLSCGTLGNGTLMPECSTGTMCGASQIPFMRRDEWTRIGPSLPIHYTADDYLGYRARLAGFPCVVCRSYEFTHIGGGGTPSVVQRAGEDRAKFLAAITTPIREAAAA